MLILVDVVSLNFYNIYHCMFIIVRDYYDGYDYVHYEFVGFLSS